MQNKNWIRTGVAAVMVAGSAFAAVKAIPTASAATAACGSECMTLADQASGSGSVTAVRLRDRSSFVVMAAAGRTSSEDFTRLYEGTVATFYAHGIVGSAVGQTWPSDSVYEYQYTPDGHQSSMCIGLATTAADGTPLTLQPCGSTSKVIWIALSAARIGGYEPLVNGSDTAINTPYVMTASQTGDVLTTQELSLVDGTLDPQQMWTDVNGVL